MDIQVLGEGLLATGHEPGHPESVLNWRGVNYVPQPEPPEGQLLVDQMRKMEQHVGDDPYDQRDVHAQETRRLGGN